MVKWIAWGLVAANVLVAGLFLTRDYWPRQTAPQFAPLNVDKLSLRAQATDTASDASAPAAVTETAFCLEWRGLGDDEVVQVREQLKTLAGQRVMSFTEVPVDTRHWVIFPPLPSADAATTKLSELVAAGLTDAFVVKDAEWRNAISLGLYANGEAAQRRVREAEDKGVLGTRVEVLPRQGTGFYFVIRSEDPDALKSLGSLQQGYPNSRQSRVACTS